MGILNNFFPDPDFSESVTRIKNDFELKEKPRKLKTTLTFLNKGALCSIRQKME